MAKVKVIRTHTGDQGLKVVGDVYETSDKHANQLVGNRLVKIIEAKEEKEEKEVRQTKEEKAPRETK